MHQNYWNKEWTNLITKTWEEVLIITPRLEIMEIKGICSNWTSRILKITQVRTSQITKSSEIMPLIIALISYRNMETLKINKWWKVEIKILILRKLEGREILVKLLIHQIIQILTLWDTILAPAITIHQPKQIIKPCNQFKTTISHKVQQTKICINNTWKIIK